MLSCLLSEHKVERADVVHWVAFEVGEVDFDLAEVAKYRLDQQLRAGCWRVFWVVFSTIIFEWLVTSLRQSS